MVEGARSFRSVVFRRVVGVHATRVAPGQKTSSGRAEDVFRTGTLGVARRPSTSPMRRLASIFPTTADCLFSVMLGSSQTLIITSTVLGDGK